MKAQARRLSYLVMDPLGQETQPHVIVFVGQKDDRGGLDGIPIFVKTLDAQRVIAAEL